MYVWTETHGQWSLPQQRMHPFLADSQRISAIFNESNRNCLKNILKIGGVLPWGLKTHHLSIWLVIFSDHVFVHYIWAGKFSKIWLFSQLVKWTWTIKNSCQWPSNIWKEWFPYQFFGPDFWEFVIIQAMILGIKTSSSQIFRCGSVWDIL